MVNADVVIAITEEQLTSLSQETYNAAYPQIFTGTVQYLFEETNFTINWDVKAAPVFDLSPSNVAKRAVTHALTERIKDAHIAALDLQRSTSFLEQHVANCSVRLPQVVIVI